MRAGHAPARRRQPTNAWTLPAPITAAIVLPIRLRISRLEPAPVTAAIEIAVAVLAAVAIVRVAPVVVAPRLVAPAAAPVSLARAHAVAEAVVPRAPLDLPRVAAVVVIRVAIRRLAVCVAGRARRRRHRAERQSRQRYESQ